MPVSRRTRTALPTVTWTEHVTQWKDCQLCPLAAQRGRICLARGAVPCDVLFVGEAPGASEDALGQPFRGPAGEVLDQIVERAVPTDVPVAFTNLVCCFPREAKERGDNEPEDAEILACRPRLTEFVNLSQPRLIVCVGSLATQYVDHGDTVPCVDIIHPAATFPPRMPQAQAQMARQRAVTVLRDAVGRAMATPRRPFEEWGTNAKLTAAQGIRQRYDAWMQSQHDVPF